MLKSKGTRKSTYQKRQANKRRKGVRSVVFPWLRRFGLVLAAVITIGWFAAWFFMSDADTKTSDWVQNKIIMTTASLGFVVDDIYVEGRVHADPEILKAIINVKKGSPLFSFNPTDAKDLIERISWVKSAHVERRWPGTIFIGLDERQPIALYQTKKDLQLLDEKGEVISVNTIAPFKDLLIVLGEGAQENAPELIKNINAEELIEPTVKSAMRVSNRRWDLLLNNGMKVKLPEDDVGLALRRLSDAQTEDKILEKDLEVIDLRDSSRMIVRTRPGAAQTYQNYNSGYQPVSDSKSNNI